MPLGAKTALAGTVVGSTGSRRRQTNLRTKLLELDSFPPLKGYVKPLSPVRALEREPLGIMKDEFQLPVDIPRTPSPKGKASFGVFKAIVKLKQLTIRKKGYNLKHRQSTARARLASLRTEQVKDPLKRFRNFARAVMVAVRMYRSINYVR